MLDVLKRLRGPKSSAQWDDEIPVIEAKITAARGDLESLLAAREAVIFDGGDLEAHGAKVRAKESEIETLAVALSGAQKRRNEASEAERNEVLEALAEEGREALETATEAALAFDDLARKIAVQAEILQRCDNKIFQVNAELREAERHDLKVTAKVSALFRRSGATQWTNPVSDLCIRGYWPKNSDGPPDVKANAARQ